jgi:hypothetical protein
MTNRTLTEYVLRVCDTRLPWREADDATEAKRNPTRWVGTADPDDAGGHADWPGEDPAAYPVAVLGAIVDEARELVHDYYLEPADDDDDDVRLGLTEPEIDVRMCAACEVQPAARDDRYCEACGTASDREAWADRAARWSEPVTLPDPPAPISSAYCPALVIVPMEIGQVTHMCTRPAGHAGAHRSSHAAPNGRDRFTWSVGTLA